MVDSGPVTSVAHGLLLLLYGSDILHYDTDKKLGNLELIRTPSNSIEGDGLLLKQGEAFDWLKLGSSFAGRQISKCWRISCLEPPD